MKMRYMSKCIIIAIIGLIIFYIGVFTWHFNVGIATYEEWIPICFFVSGAFISGMSVGLMRKNRREK